MSSETTTTEATHTAGSEGPLVRVRELKKYFDDGLSILDRAVGEDRSTVRAVDSVGFDIYEGEAPGDVWESGCGKSTVGGDDPAAAGADSRLRVVRQN